MRALYLYLYEVISGIQAGLFSSGADFYIQRLYHVGDISYYKFELCYLVSSGYADVF